MPGARPVGACGGLNPKVMDAGLGGALLLFGGPSSERSLGSTGIPLGSRLSGIADFGLPTTPAADLGRSMGLSMARSLLQAARQLTANPALGS